MYYFVADIIVM